MTRAFWEDIAAPAWVAEQDALDRQLVPHNSALLAAAQLKDGHQVIDAGCGAGAFTLEVARVVAPTGGVTGVDFSPQMLALALKRATGSGLPVAFVEADLETWSSDAAVDVVVSRLGLTDSPQILSALSGCLGPGGRLVATVFREVSLNEWMLLPTLAVAGVLPVQLPPPGAGGPLALAEPERTSALLHGAGFIDVDLAPLDYDVRMTGPTGGGVDVVLRVGPAAAALAAADAAGLELARQAVAEALAPHDDGDGAVLRASAWLITARVDDEPARLLRSSSGSS